MTDFINDLIMFFSYILGIARSLGMIFVYLIGFLMLYAIILFFSGLLTSFFDWIREKYLRN